jgi:hypothetical protein
VADVAGRDDRGIVAFRGDDRPSASQHIAVVTERPFGRTRREKP